MTTTLAVPNFPVIAQLISRRRHWLALLLWLVIAPVQAASKQQLLDELPQAWAKAATAGNVDDLLRLYSREAFIHVVFTTEELRGHDQIRAYYAKHSQHPPTVVITEIEENSLLETVGILSGKARVSFPDQEPMTTHFSIVARWDNDRWLIHLQYTSRING